MHPDTYNQLKERLYTRLTHHKYLLGVCGLDYSGKPRHKIPFPFEVDTVHPAQVGSFSRATGVFKSGKAESEKPRYIVMMPVVLPESQAKLVELMNKFFNEACESASERRRTTLIVGVNIRRGLDSEYLNRIHDFCKEWQNVPFSCIVLGFVWDPQYTQLQSKWKYDVYKTYRILELIDSDIAHPIKMQMRQIKVNIPYVNIREQILGSPITERVFDSINIDVTYLGIADPDAVNFNRIIKGADIEIARFKENKGDFPDMYSPGYEASSDDPEVIQTGLKIDRRIRTVTNDVIGMGSYFSETFILFRVKKSVKDFSFVTKETSKSQALESRRLYQNGVRGGLIDPDKIAHGGDYPIITTVMERMKTSFIEENLEMTKENLFTSKALKCICGLTYNHISPREWANNLYVVLPIKAANTQSVIIPMQEIYKAVHPVYAGYGWLGYNFSSDDFNEWLIQFNAYLNAISEYWSTSIADYPLQGLDQPDAEYAAYKGFLDTQFEALNNAWKKLTDAGVDEEWIDKIYFAAFYSGSETSKLLYRGRKLIKP